MALNACTPLPQRPSCHPLSLPSFPLFHLQVSLSPTQNPSSGHIIFLDAGSTGTRVHVFRYEAPRQRASTAPAHAAHSTTPSHAYARIHLPEPKLKVEPGLSHFANDPASAAASIRPLIEFARSHVPAPQRASTPVRLMATAGLRLLPPGAAAAILGSCRRELLRSGFEFRDEWAEVISGRVEGLFAWAAANYAGGALEEAARQSAVARKSPRDWSQFAGLLELGGASAQVTFLMLDQEREQQQAEEQEEEEEEAEVDTGAAGDGGSRGGGSSGTGSSGEGGEGGLYGYDTQQPQQQQRQHWQTGEDIVGSREQAGSSHQPGGKGEKGFHEQQQRRRKRARKRRRKAASGQQRRHIQLQLPGE